MTGEATLASLIRRVIYPPGSPCDGVRAALILVNGAPVELIWFRKDPRTLA
jgi:hypothetical protein